MFERFTERARRTLYIARLEASRTGSRAIEPEHLLLALIQEPRAVARMLPTLSPAEIRREVLERIDAGEPISTSVEIPFAASAKLALQFAAQEADRLQDNHIGAEHLLLGLLRDDASAAASVLVGHGVSLDDLHERMASVPRPHERQEPAGPGQPRPADMVAGMQGMIEHIAQAPGLPEEARVLIERIRRDFDALRRVIDPNDSKRSS